MIKRIAVTGLVVAACGLAGAGGLAGVGTVAAEEVRQQLNAPMILNLLARPLESPEAAFNKELKNYAGVSAAARGDEGEVLADGSVRYGRGAKSLTVTIRNPCPPGDIEHEMAQLSSYRQLPGRARR
jgi:hypothetical protein